MRILILLMLLLHSSYGAVLPTPEGAPEGFIEVAEEERIHARWSNKLKGTWRYCRFHRKKAFSRNITIRIPLRTDSSDAGQQLRSDIIARMEAVGLTSDIVYHSISVVWPKEGKPLNIAVGRFLPREVIQECLQAIRAAWDGDIILQRGARSHEVAGYRLSVSHAPHPLPGAKPLTAAQEQAIIDGTMPHEEYLKLLQPPPVRPVVLIAPDGTRVTWKPNAENENAKAWNTKSVAENVAWFHGGMGNAPPHGWWGAKGESVLALNAAELDLDDYVVAMEVCPVGTEDILFMGGMSSRWLYFEINKEKQLVIRLNQNGKRLTFPEVIIHDKKWIRLAMSYVRNGPQELAIYVDGVKKATRPIPDDHYPLIDHLYEPSRFYRHEWQKVFTNRDFGRSNAYIGYASEYSWVNGHDSKEAQELLKIVPDFTGRPTEAP